MDGEGYHGNPLELSLSKAVTGQQKWVSLRLDVANDTGDEEFIRIYKNFSGIHSREIGGFSDEKEFTLQKNI